MGDGEGKVDAERRLTRIVEDITNNGASLSHFWEIQSLFNLFFDGHLSLPATNFNFYEYSIKLIPMRQNLNPSTQVNPTFSLDEAGNLALAITWGDGDGTSEESVVETINNMTVQEFYQGIADNPTLRIPYQTTGARLNSLIKDGGLLSKPGGGGWTGRPSDLLPASFEVTYAGGGEEPETWYTGISSDFFFSVIYPYSDPPMITLNRTLAEAVINRPGTFYQVVQQLQGILLEIELYEFDQLDELDPVRSFTEEGRLGEKNYKQEAPASLFSGPNYVESGAGEKVGAYRLEEDYAIFKLSSFDVNSFDAPYFLWKQMTIEAKDAGVKNVLIDISGNGGGFLLAGYTLIIAMFPDIDLKWLLDAWDIVFNDPMQIFYYQMLPLLVEFLDDLLLMTEADLQATLDDVTETELQRLQVAAVAARELCINVDVSDGSFDQVQCSTLDYLVGNVAAFTSYPGLNELLAILSTSTIALLEYNPW